MKNTDGSLWKGLIEDLIDNFLQFFFLNIYNQLDKKRNIRFLDKELRQIYPYADVRPPKFIDKLVEVPTKDNEKEYILIHVEVQGYQDKTFSQRMFSYFSRLFDKYKGKKITAIAIFTDRNKKYHPFKFEYDYQGTSVTYKFNTYKIIDQDENQLAKSDNPFAIAILTVLLALKSKKHTDEELLGLKLQIARDLLQRKISSDKIRALMIFLRQYVNFDNPETSINFDEKVSIITENKITMGIEEMVLERAKKEARKESKVEFVKNLITKTALLDTQIADIAEVSIDFVKKARQKIEKAKG